MGFPDPICGTFGPLCSNNNTAQCRDNGSSIGVPMTVVPERRPGIGRGRGLVGRPTKST